MIRMKCIKCDKEIEISRIVKTCPHCKANWSMFLKMSQWPSTRQAELTPKKLELALSR